MGAIHRGVPVGVLGRLPWESEYHLTHLLWAQAVVKMILGDHHVSMDLQYDDLLMLPSGALQQLGGDDLEGVLLYCCSSAAPTITVTSPLPPPAWQSHQMCRGAKWYQVIRAYHYPPWYHLTSLPIWRNCQAGGGKDVTVIVGSALAVVTSSNIAAALSGLLLQDPEVLLVVAPAVHQIVNPGWYDDPPRVIFMTAWAHRRWIKWQSEEDSQQSRVSVENCSEDKVSIESCRFLF